MIVTLMDRGTFAGGGMERSQVQGYCPIPEHAGGVRRSKGRLGLDAELIVVGTFLILTLFYTLTRFVTKMWDACWMWNLRGT